MTNKSYHVFPNGVFVLPSDWFYSEKWGVYQKVNNEIYVYVSRLFVGWKAQAYMRGSVDFCTLEARTSDPSQVGLEKMIAFGNEWLHKYGDDSKAMEKDFFHIDFGEAWTSGEKKYWT